MLKKFHFSLPNRENSQYQFCKLSLSSCLVECAEIAERHSKLVMLVVPNTKTLLRFQEEIQQFTCHPVFSLYHWNTLPFSNFSPNHDIVSSRISTLYRLPNLKRGILILSVNTLMQRYCPHDFLYNHILIIKKGQSLSRKWFLEKLEQAGYRLTNQVIEHGEYSIHDSIICLFPIGSKHPCQIDFSDDTINKLHLFDIDKQKIIEEIHEINLLPTHEFPVNKNAIELFCNQWKKHLGILREPEHIYQQISKGILPSGIEYWQPLFFRKPLVPLFRYLPRGTIVVSIGNLENNAKQFWQNILAHFKNYRFNPMRPLLPPKTLWLCTKKLLSELKQWSHISMHMDMLPNKAVNNNFLHYYQPLPRLTIIPKIQSSFKNLQNFLKNYEGAVVFSVKNEDRREIIQKLLKSINLLPKIIKRFDEAIKIGHYIMLGSSDYGFIDNKRKRALICENDLLNDRIAHFQKIHHIVSSDMTANDLSELRSGQPIVHLEHGIGRYIGLRTLKTGGITTEYVMLAYANDTKLYIPVSSLHLISRYSGNSKNAPLHKLGSDVWVKTQKKAAKKMRDIAVELLDIYAHRAARTGYSFKYNHKHYQLFCDSFPFKITSDQEQAIHAVISDMCQPLIMDRLVCGDVGFGKTEVAMRAAFLAIENKKQVVVLVPTTLLAQQHYDNFLDRFANWPANIEMLSRFRSIKEQKKVLEETRNGRIDILIGTHKLLTSNLKWHDLGLLIIDEEHRFGVRHKEKIKAMRSNIDTLTLTATPIPRTLHMAMSGIRDLSIIATPPARRLAVKTFVREYNSLEVREAILREILRGGQVYYLYNNVKSIERVARRLSVLVPEAHIAIGHGQMRERDLERVMSDFHHQRFNVLVCTTIIETGIDISTANTIIIEQADQFSLAQLHQLRGRVGRSHQQAYAWLLTSSPKEMSSDAHKRLEAISSLEDLGAGFALAIHDLEIRGAGELLGENQSGQMESIGISLYMELLKHTIDTLKDGREPSLEDLVGQQTDIELRVPALLPDDFVPDVNIRLSFYKRIASSVDCLELDNLKMELIDRFGDLPDVAQNLLDITALRITAQKIGIRRIEADEKGGFIEFAEQSKTNKVDPTWIISLLQNPHQWQLNGPTRLKFKCNLIEYKFRINWIQKLIEKMQEHMITD